MGLCIAPLEDNRPDIVIVSRSNVMLEQMAPKLLTSCHRFGFIRAVPGFVGTIGKSTVVMQGLGYGDVSAAMYMAEILDELKPKMILKLDEMMSIDGNIPLGTVVLAQTANTTSKMNRYIFRNKVFPASADFALTNNVYSLLERENVSFVCGPVLTINTLHEIEVAKRFADHGILAVDFEINQVYTPCNLAQIPVLGFGVVSEDLVTGQKIEKDLLSGLMDTLWNIAQNVCVTSQE